MKTLLTTLTTFFLCFSTVFAQTPNSTEELTSFEKQRNGICLTWTKNVMYGATQNLRGASKEVQFIKTEMLIEMIRHGLGADKLYFMDEKYTNEERQWLIDSARFGYDWMTKWLEANEGEPLPDEHAAAKIFYDICRSDPKYYELFLKKE